MSLQPEMVSAFWIYLQEREYIRLRRARGDPWPWTVDHILQTYKFTNVKRIYDRTTLAFLKIYTVHKNAAPEQALYNCGLYRYFGTDSWANTIGWLVEHDEELIIETAERMLRKGYRVFTPAYIITNSGRTGPKSHVVAGYLSELWKAAHFITEKLWSTKKWEEAFRVLSRVPGFGGSGFMAKEVLQDYLLWLPWEPTDAATFTPLGPGGRRGLNRVCGRTLYHTQSEKEWFSELAQLRDEINPLWSEFFEDSLTAHDIQFSLCEFDKYQRVATGKGKPKAKYHYRQESLAL